ncbi:MAG: DUF2157 domain-containing protein [Clostridia bacterium]|jgi:uncharacterized membrane protein|nr:DUF2157 domain-containing protein [Clostridia bacterium]
MFFNQNLQRELPRWVADGLITPENAETLRQRYPVTKNSMTQTLALLGSVLLGIGVILFFAANWEAMSRTLKIAVVVLAVLLAYGGGYYLRYVRGTYPKVGYALICLGSLLYGAAIWLIGQIFHLAPEAGSAFLLWYLGVIPVAWLFQSSFNLVLALFNLTAWFIAGHYPLSWPFLFFPLLLVLTILPPAIRKKNHFVFVLAVLAGYIWFIPLGVKLAGINYSFQLGIISLLLFSLVIYLLGQWAERRAFFAEGFLQALSFVGLFAGLAAFTFHDFLSRFGADALGAFPWLIAGTLAVIVLLKIKERQLTLRDIPLLLLLLCLLPFFPQLGESSFLLIALNVLFFILTLGAVYYGYQAKRPLLFNLGMLLFAVAVAMKYFDIFFALLPRSAFFMSGGVLLLAGSFLLEYKRRDLLKSMEEGAGQ